jgi:L-seryl-tRNA(Ser) seleniumtransferase
MPTRLSRRQLFGLAGLLGLRRAAPAAAGQAGSPVRPAAAAATDVYKALGVRPLINCRGTLTIIGGSIELAEVRAAKSAANGQHAHLDELMEAIGRRLAELTGAEWGMVSAGCAAAMSHATAACVAGGNPDPTCASPTWKGS